MEEYIDILTDEGVFTGESCLKSEIHRKGHYHNTVHIWLYTKQGQILLQQRSFKKLIYPGLWDVSAAGHVDAGETVLQAAIRETGEELGYVIKPAELIRVGTFKCFQTYENGIIDNEFHNTFISQLNIPLNELKFLEEEVEAIKLVSFSKFIELLRNSKTNNHFVATNFKYYNIVLDFIKSRIN